MLLSQDRRRKAKNTAKAGQATAAIANPQKHPHGKKRVPTGNTTLDLFGGSHLPEGMKYEENFLSAAEEQALLQEIQYLPFREFEFHGFTGKRRTVSFGWRYDFNGGGLTKTEDMPNFLRNLCVRAERFAGAEPGRFQQVLVTEYAPGAGIGWHKDRSVFGDVVGISLLSSCTFRLRKRSFKGFTRQNLVAAPRSVYLLRGPFRTEWEHSIPGVERLRYSVTFRDVRDEG